MAAATLGADVQSPLIDPPAGSAMAGLRHAGKRFGGTVALENASFDLLAGEVLALLGENGAGKSTCVKLLAGVHRPDSGAVLVGGAPVERWSPLEAQRRGIAVMHQHPGLFGDLTVFENIFIGHMPRGPFGIDRNRMRAEAKALLNAVGLSCSPDDMLKHLRTSEQQLVEIARALSTEAKVLIMDEPTAALSQREVERLFAVVANLKTKQVAMMFVGHRMEEIYRVADRVAVLRDGHLLAIEAAGDLDRDHAVQLMVGRPLSAVYPERRLQVGEPVLEVEDLSRDGAFQGVSFEVRTGEVFGLAGLVGSGRTEIARVLFGIDQPSAGRIKIAGETVTFADPSAAMEAGIAYLSEDRLGQSLTLDFPILSNASLPVVGKATMAGLVMRRRELRLVEPHLRRLRLKFRDFNQPVKTLSGGNQQKVVLSKWLATNPRLLILDEPTQGIDVQSKAEVHAMIAELAGQGLAIILISSELPELVGMCDRMIVLREGQATAHFLRDDVDQERIIRAATDADRIGAEGGAPGPIAAMRAHPAHEAETADPLIRRILRRREVGLACAIAAVTLPVMLLNPHMVSAENLLAVAMDAALLMIVAVAQMLVLLTRNIDLSVASVIGLAAYGSASFMHAYPGAPVLTGIGVACLIGLACGLANGVVVTIGRVPAIVVTLGTLAVFRGIDSLVAGGHQISADQVPQAWLDVTSTKIAGVPAMVLIAIATLGLIALALRRLPAGRELYAIGSNPDGASLIGIRTTALVLGAFVMAGLLAGFDGAMWASRYATIDARVAMGYELTVIASVVVGGVAIRGGAGTVLGVALGVLTLLVIQNGLTLVRVDPLWLQGVYGLVILIAVSVDTIVGRSIQPARGAAMKAATFDRVATWENFLAVLMLATLVYAVAAVPNFATNFNLSQAIAGVSERALIVLPMVLLIIAREIDLSVASILALCSVVFGVLIQGGAPLSLAATAALAVGAAAGAFNGALVTYLGLPSLVVTLGTLAMFRGIGYIILGSASVNEFPDALTDFGINTLGDSAIPWTIVPFLVLAPIFAVVLRWTAIGRRIYAVGGSPDVARYAGVRVDRIRLCLFVVSGVVCAIAGIVFTARLANARADNAVGLELDVITIALLGGVNVFGGRGKLSGVFYALVLIATLRNVLGLRQIGGDAQGTVIGLLLILSLLLSTTAQRFYGSLAGLLGSTGGGSANPGNPSPTRHAPEQQK